MQYCSEARRTLAQANRTLAIVQRSLRGETGNVKVGFAGNAVLTGKLMDDLRGFHRTYPDVQIELLEMAPHLQGEAIIAGELDVGYSPSAGFTADPRRVTEKIGEWPLLVAMADDHPLAARKRVSARSIAKEQLIVYAADENDQAFGLLRRQFGADMNRVHRVSSTLSVLALAAAGFGVAIVPAPLDKVTIPHLVYRPFAEKDMFADLLLLSRADETDGAVRAFLTLARKDS